MIKRLESLAEKGVSFPDASFNPVVNIMFDSSHVDTKNPNNLALYFTGKQNQYRYYVHAGRDGSLVAKKKKLPCPPNDWVNHLQFSYHYYSTTSLKSEASTPRSQPASLKCSEASGSNERGSTRGGGASPGQPEEGHMQRKPAGNDLTTAVMRHAQLQKDGGGK